MTIREVLSRGKRSYFDMTQDERETERARLRAQDRSDLNKNVFLVLLSGAAIYLVLTIIAVMVRISA